MKQAVDYRDMLGHAIFKVVMVAKNANVMEPVLHTINAHCESLHAVRSEDDVYTITHVDATKGKIMELLLLHAGETVTKSMLSERLWGTTEYIDENALQVNMTRIKKTIRKLLLPYRIETRRGIGYCLKEIGESED